MILRDDDLFPAADDRGLATLIRIAGAVGITCILAALIGLALELLR